MAKGCGLHGGIFWGVGVGQLVVGTRIGGGITGSISLGLKLVV